MRARVAVAVGIGLVLVGGLALAQLVGGAGGVVPGDPAGSGVAADRTPPAPTERIWSVDVDVHPRPDWLQVGVGEDVAVVTSTGGHHGIDAETGDLRWRIPLEVAEVPAFVGGGLLVARSAGELVAFDLADGERRWAWSREGVEDDGTLYSAELAAGAGHVFIADDVLVAVDAATGAEAWRIGLRDELQGSLLGIVGVAGGAVHLHLSRPAGATGPGVTRHLVALDLASGRLIWERDAPAAPALDDDHLYLPDRGEVTVVEATSGEPVRSVEVPFDPPTDDPRTPANLARPWLHVHGDVLLAGLDDETVALDHRSGQVRWSREGGPTRVTAVVGSTAYLAGTGEVVAVDLATGQERDLGGVAGPGPVQVAAGPGGAVITAAPDGTVTRLADDGTVWRATTVVPPGVALRPLGDGRVAVPVPDGVQVVDASDGTAVWAEHFDTDPRVFARLEPRAGVDGDAVYLIRPTGAPDGGVGAAVLAALDAETGEPRWQRTLDEPPFAVTGGPVAVDGRVFVGTVEGLWALDADSGQPLYHVSTHGLRVRARGAVTRIAALGDDLVFVVEPGRSPLTGLRRQPTDGLADLLDSSQRLIVSADPADGEVNWQTTATAAACGPIAVAPDVVLAPTTVGLVAHDLATGEQRWEHAAAPSCRAAATAGTTVIVVDSTSGVHALDLATGRSRWTSDLDATVSAAPVIAGEVALVAAGDQLVGLSLDDGAVRWRETLDEPIGSPVLIADGVLVTSSPTGRLSGHR